MSGTVPIYFRGAACVTEKSCQPQLRARCERQSVFSASIIDLPFWTRLTSERAVSAECAAITEASRKVYDANVLVDELEGAK